MVKSLDKNLLCPHPSPETVSQLTPNLKEAVSQLTPILKNAVSQLTPILMEAVLSVDTYPERGNF